MDAIVLQSAKRRLAADKVRQILTDICPGSLTSIIAGRSSRSVAISRSGQNDMTALKLADKAIIMNMGRVVFDGGAQQASDDGELHRHYLSV